MKTINSLHTKTRLDFIKIMYIITIGITFMEVFILIVDLYMEPSSVDINKYIVTYIWYPSSYNVLMCILATMINQTKWSEKKKSYGIVFCMTKLCATIAIIHSTFISTQCAFVGSIMAAALLGNSSVIFFATIDGVAMLALSLILAPYFNNNADLIQLSKSAIVTVLILCLTGVMANLIVKVRERHESILKKYIIDLEKASREAKCDAMTGLYNHVEFYNTLHKLRDKQIQNITVAIIDIDKFKLINDTYGHKNGDKVIIEIANHIKVFNNDLDTFAFRYGGEEFALIFADKPSTYSDIRLQNLKSQIAGIRFDFDVEKQVTLSAGVYDCKLQELSSESIFIRADKALYFSKQNGRNQINKYNDLTDDQLKSMMKI